MNELARCVDENTFKRSLFEINPNKITEHSQKKITEFFERNQEYLLTNRLFGFKYNEIGIKLTQINPDDPLVAKLRKCVAELFPSNSENIISTLEYIKSERWGAKIFPDALADWKNFMGISGLDRDDVQQLLVDYFKRWVDGNIWEPVENVKGFGFVDERTRIEVAKYAANSVGPAFARNIRNFEITDQQALYELAMINGGRSPGGIINNIGKFGIQNEHHRIEIAKQCAANDGGSIAAWIRNFRILDKDALAEIARLAITGSFKMRIWDNYTWLFNNLKNFDLNDDQFFQIALECAEINGAQTAQFFRYFGIKDEKNRIHIAKICAQKSGSATALYFKEFDIKDESVKVEICKLCLVEDCIFTVHHFRQFEITNQEALVEIVSYCAQKEGNNTMRELESFKIVDRKVIFDLALRCLYYDENALFNLKYLNYLRGLNKLPLMVKVLQSEEESTHERNLLSEHLKEHITQLPCSDKNKIILQNIWEVIIKYPIHLQNVSGRWFVRFIILSKQMKEENLDWTIENGLWDDLLNLRDPVLRERLTPGLIELSSSEFKKDLPEGKNGFKLLAIPLSAMELYGVETKQLSTKLKKLERHPTSIFNVLHTLTLLVNADFLSEKEKVQGFNKIFNDLELKQVMKNVTAAKGLLQLKNTEWVSSENDLGTVFKTFFEKLIPLEGFQGSVSESYDEIFAVCRYPDAIIEYAANLKTLDEPELLPYLGTFVRSVFEKKFKQLRYSTENNPHLVIIFESRPDLVELWQADHEVSLSVNGSNGPSFNPKEWIEKVLFEDHHLRDTDLSFLRNFCVAALNEALKIVTCQQERDALRGKKSAKKELAKLSEKVRKDPLVARLKLQQACIALIQAEPKDYLKRLLEINTIIHHPTEPPTHFADMEFATDVKGMIDYFTKPQNQAPSSNLKICLTDDPIDLLLCGTDVAGSCQRVNGHPDNNRGLLGYIMDGKNRLLAIKDQSGKIVARCIIRLLWDGEQPVLYRERYYPCTICSSHQEALNAFTAALGDKLNVPVTCNDKGEPYGKALEAIGGPAPYEYSDGARGVHPQGKYIITQVFLAKANQ